MDDIRSSVFRFTHVAVMVAVVGFCSAADNGISPVRADSSDDYLKAIEAEGNHLEFLGQAKKEQEMLMRSAPTPPAKASRKTTTAASKQSARSAPPAPSSAPPVSVTQQEFEKSLREHFPGSYALYTILEPRDRESVFREYENAKSDGTIRFLPAVTRLISLSSTGRAR